MIFVRLESNEEQYVLANGRLRQDDSLTSSWSGIRSKLKRALMKHGSLRGK